MSKSKKDEGTEGMMIDAADWQARATHIRQVLAGAPDTAVAEALGTFLFADDDGKTWTYNGAAWMSWDGTQWSEGKVPAELSMQAFLHDTAAETADAAAVATAAPEIATADAAMTGSAAMTAETPEAAAAEAAADGKPAEAAKPVSTEAILASVAAADAEADAKDADAKSEAAATKAEDKPAEAAASDVAAVAQPAATDAGSASAATAGVAAGGVAATAAATPADATPAMGTSQPAAATAAAAIPAATAAASTPGAFRATHTVPSPGMGAWSKPDPSVRPEYQLAPRTELMVVEMTSSGWARVAGSNGWTGWVDGRQLQAIGAAPQPAAQTSWQQPAQAQQPAQTSWQQPAQQPTQSWQQPAQAQPAQTWQQPAPTAQPASAQTWQQPAAAQQPAATPQPVAAPQPAPAQQPAAVQQPAAAQGGFRPTHAVPPMGMPAWAQPNPALPPQAQLGAGTQLMVAEWSQSGWARVVAANGWSGWVDGRMLVAFR